MDLFEITKGVISGLASAGSSLIVAKIVEDVMPPAMKLPAKAVVLVGQIAISGIVSLAAMDYTAELVDNVGEAVNNIVKTITNE